jgi:predicted dienelactone hydrolase
MMFKGKKNMGLSVGLGLAVCLLPFLKAEGVKTFAPDGPYKVGVVIEHMELGERTAPVMIWYPAKAVPGAEPYNYMGELKGSAILDAPVERSNAPYPLIMFSHGMGGCGCQSVFYTENLASFGYVIVAPDHKDSAMCHIEGEPDITAGKIVWSYLKGGGNLSKTVFTLFADAFDEMEFDLSYRPVEASATIDQALAWNSDPGHMMHGMMDTERIGISGHSLGGFTSLMVGGVPFHCEGVELTPQDCDVENMSLERAINPCCMEYIRDADPFQARDERVRAMIPLGPAVFFPELERAATEIEIPVMIITGANKKMEVPWEPIWTFYQNAPPPRYVIRLKKTDHMTVADQTLSATSLVRLFLPGFRFHFRDKAHAYKDYSVAFFDLYLKGDDSKAATLHSPTNRFVELWYEAE